MRRLNDAAFAAPHDSGVGKPNRVSDEAIRLGRCLLARDRLREPVYRALMGLHARQGERTEALKLYAACRDALKQDLGVAPDGKTEELYRDILTDRPSAPTSASEAEPTPARPSIAVLPFGNLSGDTSAISATVSPKTSSRSFRAFARYLSSHGIPHSPSKGRP
jgi:hypothetical protein